MEAGQHSQVLYSMFSCDDTPSPPFPRRNDNMNSLIHLRFRVFPQKLMLRRTKPSGILRTKILLANFSSADSLTTRAEVVPVCKESQNGLESTEDRRSAVRHGDQHVCERDPQVIG